MGADCLLDACHVEHNCIGGRRLKHGVKGGNDKGGGGGYHDPIGAGDPFPHIKPCAVNRAAIQGGFE